MNKEITYALTFSVIFQTQLVFANLSLLKTENTQLNTNLNLSLGAFSSNKGYIASHSAQSYQWLEGYAQYGMDATHLIGMKKSSIYGQVSLVSATTKGDGDAGGYTNGKEAATRIEDAYIGWKSGELFSFLGKDGIDITYGRQNFCLNDGFLVCSDEPNLGNTTAYPHKYATKRGGAYYLAAHKDFKNTAILKIAQNKVINGSIFTFKSNQPIQMQSQFIGGNLNYRDNLSLIYLHNTSLNDSYADPAILGQNAYRKHINVYSILGHNQALIQNTDLSFQYAYQDKKNNDHANAWFVRSAYTFSKYLWEPTISLRYSRFSSKWDNLFVGGSEYGTWFQGEVAYNYAGPFNSNVQVVQIGAKFTPRSSLTFGALYYNFRTLEKNNSLNLSANEIDLYSLIAVNKNINISPVIAFYKPSKSSSDQGLQNGNNHLNIYSSLVFTMNF